jgi:hypothetical protein
MKKILIGFAGIATAVALIPMFAAFEAHVINVTAKIENALNVPLDHLDFGTVFPQEHLEKELPLTFSQSFLDEDRVDDVEYIIRQKPKCGLTNDNGTQLIGPTATGHIIVDPVTGDVTIDCGPAPLDDAGAPIPGNWGVLPNLCPYISKDGGDEDGSEQQNDDILPSFHQPWQIVGTGTDADPFRVEWLDTRGRMSKAAGDMRDLWIIDLAVPCFGGYCAQDWAEFVASHNPQADANEYTQDIADEHKIFGCDLWVEVSGVSEQPCDPGVHSVVSDTSNTVDGAGAAVAVAPIHSAWTASIPGATWIWSENPTSAQNNQSETFVKSFNVSGTLVSAVLDIATDNTYSVEVNGVPTTCASATADNFSAATQDSCNLAPYLTVGNNTIEITVNNIGLGNISSNPAGLLYKLTYETTCE